jgi:Zn-dependent protease
MFEQPPTRPLFTVFGIPVGISIWHVLLLLMLFYPYLQESLAFGIGVMVAASFSVLMHEMGHALVSLLLRLEPAIMLTGFGGYTMHQPAKRPRDEFFVVAAGPTMNFVLAAAFYMVGAATEGMVADLAGYAALLNVVWGAYNLMPIFPLDGGQLLKWLLNRFMKPLKADRAAYWTGLILGGVLAVVGLTSGKFFVTVILGLAAFENWQMLKRLDQSPARHLDMKHNRVRELLNIAHQAYQAGDFDAAMRAAHQARAEPHLSNQELEHVWQVLALSATQLHEFAEALRFAERLPASAPMAQVQATCLLNLADPALARRFLATPAARLLTTENAERLQQLARQA